VESRLSTGLEPSISLIWTIEPSYIDDGYTVMMFRSSSGLSPKPYIDDLSAHGTLIAETAASGSHTDQLPEGTYYYTFLLRRTVLFGLIEQASAVRFSVAIPSAKIGIGRIKDQLELRDLAHRQTAGVFDYETKLNEAEIRLLESRRALSRAKTGRTQGDPTVAAEVAAVQAMIETYRARRSLIDNLKQDQGFLALSPEEQAAIMGEIESRLDAGEISARREMKA
jgi:hypothetical protein